MGLWKRLAAEEKRFQKATKIQRADKRTNWQVSGLQITSGMNFDKDLPADMTDAIQRRVMRAAMRKAGRIVKKEQKRLLKPHRSKKTGTAELWSEKTESINSKRSELWKSIISRTRYDKGTETLITSVGPDQSAAWIGWFLEVGKSVVNWGRVTGEQSKPIFFMRRAGVSTLSQQRQVIRKHVADNWERDA